MFRFLILLIPLLGIGALLLLILEGIDPGARASVSGIMIKIAVYATLGAFPLLGLVSVLRRGTGSTPRTIRTRVIGARAGDGIDELTVEARHSSAVSRLPLPVGSKITTIQANALYKVEIPSNRRAGIKEIARGLGYQGEVG